MLFNWGDPILVAKAFNDVDEQLAFERPKIRFVVKEAGYELFSSHPRQSSIVWVVFRSSGAAARWS